MESPITQTEDGVLLRFQERVTGKMAVDRVFADPEDALLFVEGFVAGVQSMLSIRRSIN
jgi:hypothetical protein